MLLYKPSSRTSKYDNLMHDIQAIQSVLDLTCQLFCILPSSAALQSAHCCCKACSWPPIIHSAEPANVTTSCMNFVILLASSSAFCLFQRVHSRHTAAVGQAHTHSLNSTGHGVGSVHASTCSCPGACIAHNIMHLFLIHQASCVCACTMFTGISVYSDGQG